MQIASFTVMVALGTSWVIKMALCPRESFVIAQRINLKEPNTVYVYRSGAKLAVAEDDLTVGDLIFIDYNQTIPATGLLISKEEIEVS